VLSDHRCVSLRNYKLERIESEGRRKRRSNLRRYLRPTRPVRLRPRRRKHSLSTIRRRRRRLERTKETRFFVSCDSSPRHLRLLPTSFHSTTSTTTPKMPSLTSHYSFSNPFSFLLSLPSFFPLSLTGYRERGPTFSSLPLPFPFPFSLLSSSPSSTS